MAHGSSWTGPRNPVKMLFSHKPETYLVPEGLGFAGAHISYGEMYACVESGLVRKALRDPSCQIPVSATSEQAFWLVLLMCLALERGEHRPANSPSPAGQSLSITNQRWTTCMFTFHQAQSDRKVCVSCRKPF